MKTFTKIMSLVLALIMVAGLFVSCGNNPGGTETKAPETTAGPDDSNDPEKILPNLPDERFDGYEYRIRCRGADGTVWQSVGLDAEERTGDAINDQVLERNNYLENKYGITISLVEGGGVAGSVTQAVLNQVDEFDLALTGTNELGTLAPKYVYDLKQLEFIDLEKPWYDQNFNAELSIGGRLYATTGDLPINDDNGTWCILFNKKLAEDTSMPNLYELAASGEWTLDKLYELAKTVTRDATGDDIIDENDVWGFQTETYNAYAIVASAGEKIATKGADDLPTLTAGTERFQAVLEKAVQVCGDKSVSFLHSDFESKYSDVWNDCYIPTFTSGRVLFKMVGLQGLTIGRNMEDPLGVLPMPKYEVSQETTLSPITVGNATCVYIPISVTDVRTTSIITEALFAESRYTSRVGFYETTLQKKYTEDEESKVILDQIIENRTYDLGAVYGWGGVVTKLQDNLAKRNANWASAYKSLQRVADRALQQTIKNFAQAQNVG